MKTFAILAVIFTPGLNSDSSRLLTGQTVTNASEN
jgi:hypothetical protein